MIIRMQNYTRYIDHMISITPNFIRNELNSSFECGFDKCQDI